MVKTAYSSELGTFLAERYIPAAVDKEKYTIVCINGLTVASCTMLVGADIYNLSYWMVIYIPYNSSTRGSTETDKARIMESLDEMMK